MINYTPLMAVTMFRDSVRQWFLMYGGDFAWSADVKLNKIVIASANDYNSNEATQKMPRILVQRGALQQQVQFINNSEESVKGPQQLPTKGMRQDVNSSILVIVEADREGTCEVLAEGVRRLVVRNRPMFESEFGFLRFGHQIAISECEATTEDKEKFKIQVQIPYSVEDRWNYTPDTILLKKILGNIHLTTSEEQA